MPGPQEKTLPFKRSRRLYFRQRRNSKLVTADLSSAGVSQVLKIIKNPSEIKLGKKKKKD